MFVLSDGKNYVMENPLKSGEYITTTNPSQAKEFSYKRGKALIQKPRKSCSWVRDYTLVNVDTGEEATCPIGYKGKAGMYIGENDIEFDNELVETVLKEVDSIMGLSGWDTRELTEYKEKLTDMLSKMDSMISDVTHALETYVRTHDGKKPPAHKVTKISYRLTELLVERRRLKESVGLVSTMLEGNSYHYTISKLKLELGKVLDGEYKGRTDEYQATMDILND